MACLLRPSAALQPRTSHAAAQRRVRVQSSRSRGAGPWAAPSDGGGGWAGVQRLQVRPATPALLPFTMSGSSGGSSSGSSKLSGSSSGSSKLSGSSSGSSKRGGSSSGSSGSSKRGGSTPEARYRGGSKPSPVPDVDAQQLLRSLGLSGTADPAALLRSLRKLPGVRQQGVLDNAAAVAAHLCSPGVGLTAQQAGQLLERCPRLFSWLPEQRAAVLFGELMAVGLTAADAAQCFATFIDAANCTTLAPGLAELAAILAHSEDRDRSLGGAVPKVPAAQRTVAALLTQSPGAVLLVCQSASYLQQRAAELQQAGMSAAQVAALAWRQPELLCTDSAARVANKVAVVQQELGLSTPLLVSLVAKRRPAWLSSSVDTLRERAAALAEGFGQAAAAAMLLKSPETLECASAVWRRNLCCMAACGVADLHAVLRRQPTLLPRDHAAPDFLQRRLILQRVAQLSAAQLYERHPAWLRHRMVPDLAQRLQFVQHRGRDTAQLLVVVLHKPLPNLLAAVGASQAEWEAWAATNPPAACPLHGWAQQAAEEEAARLAAALPPELAQREPRQHSAGRKNISGS